MNEFDSANLAQETMKGLKKIAYKCLYTGGIPPLGYDVNPDKIFRINETESETIRLIFKMYAGVYILNKSASRDVRGKVNYLLTGKIYCGICESAISGELKHTNGKSYAYYRCNL